MERNGIILSIRERTFEKRNFAKNIVKIICGGLCMNVESNAFGDFVRKRCDEILADADISKNLMSKYYMRKFF